MTGIIAVNIFCRSIRSLSLGSLQLFQEIDGPLYSRIARQHKEEQEKYESDLFTKR